jgi:hypothetical protein
VVFASGHVSIKAMFTEGLVLNFIGAAVITAVCFVALAS